ncbi:D-alanyl-D-alanine carboxypeptidase family protein [Chrysiogenes arsenatis]|uniref:D-alanyl-D-alanine carboxypeptidase family protein n=1 Tax=Chrysiogenes arsenatis TaxID=309797 RepID=UPI00041DAB7B|nr:serine hydrolase [Chrysiogenes arsenatis]
MGKLYLKLVFLLFPLFYVSYLLYGALTIPHEDIRILRQSSSLALAIPERKPEQAVIPPLLVAPSPPPPVAVLDEPPKSQILPTPRALAPSMRRIPPFTAKSVPITYAEERHIRAAIVVDADSRTILYAKNHRQELPIASITKAFLMDEVYDQMKRGSFRMDTVVTTSRRASLTGGSKMYLRENDPVMISDLIKGALIHSANDAAHQLGEHIGSGDIRRALSLLNNKAHSLGLEKTRLYNVTGLPDGNRDNISTAYEVAQMAYKILVEHGEMVGVANTQLDYYIRPTGDEFMMVNRNRPLVRVDYIDGLKTGFTNRAGWCLVATSHKNGRRLITVILNATDRNTRDRAARKLIDHYSRS